LPSTAPFVPPLGPLAAPPGVASSGPLVLFDVLASVWFGLAESISARVVIFGGLGRLLCRRSDPHFLG